MNADLQKLTKLANIRHIFYVDDDFSDYILFKSSCYARCREIREADAELPFECDVVNFDDRFEIWWTSAEAKDKYKFIREQDLNRDITQIESNLNSLCEGEINIQCIAPEQSIEQIREKTEGIPQEENILFLVDKELNGHTDSNRIVDFLRNIPNKYIALFSETFKPEAEISTWLNDNHPKDVYPLAKQRFDNDSFVEGVRNVIWLKDISNLKKRTIDVLQNSIENVKSRLDSIDPATFDKTIMDVSKNEGCWEFETLYRIILSMLNQGVQEYMTANENFTHFQELTHNVRNIKEALPNIQNNPIDKERIQSIQESEWYYSENYLNSVYSPIQNGDIFAIYDENGDMKEYILLCQPCNLAIRSDGTRGKNLDYAYLVPLIRSRKSPKFCEKINSLEQGVQTKHADFPNCKRISLDVLDLVSYNAQGKAEINLKHSVVTDFLQDNMKIRYCEIWKKIHTYFDMYQSILTSNLKKENKEICLSHLRKPYEMGVLSLLLTPTINGDFLCFNIQRKNRYKEPFVQDLLQKFMRYLSRPGFAPQLTETE